MITMRVLVFLFLTFAAQVRGQGALPRFQTTCMKRGQRFVLRTRDAQRCPCFMNAEFRAPFAQPDLVADVHALPESDYSTWFKSWKDARNSGATLPDVPKDKAVSVRGAELRIVRGAQSFLYRWTSGSTVIDNRESYVAFSVISLRADGKTPETCFKLNLLLEPRPQKCPLRLAERTDSVARKRTSTVATYVVGGTRVDDGDEFTPYNAFISGTGNCTGSVISPSWILTAAHCRVDRFTVVRVGGSDLSGGDVHRVKDVIRHPRYAPVQSFTKQQIANDIALIQLASPVRNAKPIQLNSLGDGPQPSTIVRATGYGKVTTAAASRGLRMVDVVVLSESECKRRFRSGGSYSIANGIEDDVHLCTGRDRDCAQGGVCFGDSGGPIVARMPDNSLVQVGITSYGDQACATRESADVFVRVSSFVDWIQQVTGDSAKVVQWQSVGNTASGGSYGSAGGGTVLGLPLWALVAIIVGGCMIIVAVSLIFLVRRSASSPPSAEEPPYLVQEEQHPPPPPPPPSCPPPVYSASTHPPPPPSSPLPVYSAPIHPSAPLLPRQSEISPAVPEITPAVPVAPTTDINPPGYPYNVQPSTPAPVPTTAAPDTAAWQQLLLPPPQPPRSLPQAQGQEESSANIVSYPDSTGVSILQIDNNSLGPRPQQ